jgi:hypothetical protein
MCIVYMLAARLVRCSRNGAASFAFVHHRCQIVYSFVKILDENNAQRGYLAKLSSEQRAASLGKSGCEVRQSQGFFFLRQGHTHGAVKKRFISQQQERLAMDMRFFWFWFGEVDGEVSLAGAHSIVFWDRRICSLFRKSSVFGCMLCRTGDDDVPCCGKE